MAASRDRRDEWRRYYLKNWKRLNENRKRWKKENPERNRAHKLKYAAANREREAARARAWLKANPERAHAGVRNYKARKRGNGGTHTAKDLEEILLIQNGLCVYCKVEITKENRHIDHMTPISRGGSNARENLQILCRGCNLSKRARTHQEYLIFIGAQP